MPDTITIAQRAAAPSTDEAIAWLTEHFPFDGYLSLGTDAHRGIAELVRDRVPEGGEVLDIGCGPCDKLAVLSQLGYRCTGLDDFGDPWHRNSANLRAITRFAERAGVALVEGDGEALPFREERFDAVLVCDVIEHLHASPRALLTGALEVLRDDGWLVVSVPNAVSIRKRLDVLRGRTNYPPYAQFFAADRVWRGHVREYSWGDLAQLAQFLGLADASIHGAHHLLGVLPAWARGPFRLALSPTPSLRDTLILCGRKPGGWTNAAHPALPARTEHAPRAALATA